MVFGEIFHHVQYAFENNEVEKLLKGEGKYCLEGAEGTKDAPTAIVFVYQSIISYFQEIKAEDVEEAKYHFIASLIKLVQSPEPLWAWWAAVIFELVLCQLLAL